MDILLEKHKDRNYKFITEEGYFDLFMWLQDFIKHTPKELKQASTTRNQFESTLRIMGSYNSLMMELAREELDENALISYLNYIKQHKLAIES